MPVESTTMKKMVHDEHSLCLTKKEEELIMPGGYRHMYYLTGLPGWMRLGYSPGWGGMPPGAAYMMTGRWPTPQAEACWQAMQSGQPGYAGFRPGMAYGYPGSQPYAGAMVTPDQEVALLKNQAQFLNQQLEQIAARIKVLEEQAVS